MIWFHFLFGGLFSCIIVCVYHCPSLHEYDTCLRAFLKVWPSRYEPLYHQMIQETEQECICLFSDVVTIREPYYRYQKASQSQMRRYYDAVEPLKGIFTTLLVTVRTMSTTSTGLTDKSHVFIVMIRSTGTQARDLKIRIHSPRRPFQTAFNKPTRRGTIVSKI